MTQAVSCGSTPAALSRASDLASVSGICGTTVSAVDAGSTSSIPGFNAGETANGNGITSSAPTVYQRGLGLIWTLGMVAVMATWVWV